MVTQELTDYIKKYQAQGLSNTQITSDLVKVGWDKADVDRAVLQVSNPDIPLPPHSGEHQSVSSASHPSTYTMWDTFEHILMFISLYVMSTSIGLILFDFINKWFPPISLNDYYSGYSSRQDLALNGYLAALIVSFPIFGFFFIRIARQTASYPQIRELRSRKVLIYLTLIVTFLVMLGYVIATVYKFLSGNVTPNFLLHLAVTISISGLIFWYYLNEVKADRRIHA